MCDTYYRIQPHHFKRILPREFYEENDESCLDHERGNEAGELRGTLHGDRGDIRGELLGKIDKN